MIQEWKCIIILAPQMKVKGPRGPYKNAKACFFLVIKAANWLWFGMVIGIDHPQPHNVKYAPYVEVYGPQGPIYKYKGPTFS